MSELILAAKRGLYNRVLAELREGAPVDARDSENATPLYWTACSGHADICRLLLSKEADTNLSVLWGSTPLHAAADRGHTDCIKYLLRYGANVNAQNNNGDTPLHLASFRGHKEACLILVRQGADHTILNNHGKTSYQEAQLKDINKIFSDKKSAHRASSYPLTIAASRDVNVARQRLQASDSDDSLLRTKKSSLRNLLASSAEKQGEVRETPGTKRIPNTMNQLSGNSSNSTHYHHHHRAFSAPTPSMHAGPLNIDDFSDPVKLNNVATDEADSQRKQDETEHDHYIGTIDNLQLKVALLTSQKDALEMQLRDGGGSPSHELVQMELEQKLAKLTKDLEKQSQERRASDARSHQLEMELMQLKQSCLGRSSPGDVLTTAACLDTTAVTDDLISDYNGSCQKKKAMEGPLVRNISQCLLKPYLCEGASLVHVFALMQEGKAAMQILRASTNKRLCLIRSSLNEKKEGPVLDNAGTPWTFGKDYTVVNSKPIDRELKHCEEGLLPQISVKVLFQGQTYVMKILMSNKKSQKPPTHQLSTDSLGTEFSILQSLAGSPHPHITKICHHFEMPTSEVHNVVDISAFLDSAISSQLADRTAMVFFPDHYTTLDNLVSTYQGDQASCHGSTQTWNERLVLRLLLQVLRALSHLQSQGIAHRDLHPRAMLVDWNLRLVLGEFGFARRLRNGEGQGIPFVEQSQIGAGNSLAWSPELLQFLRSGPPKSWQKVLTLVDVYESSDMYSAAATLCHLFGEAEENPSSPGMTAKSLPAISSRQLGFLSAEGHVLFTHLLKESPAQRPTLQEASLRTGMLLYGPRRSDVDSAHDVESWLLAQDIRMLATPPQPNTRELDELARRLDWELCHDYFHSVSASDLWQLCNNPLTD